MNENTSKAPMDIWNPNFWVGKEGEDGGPDATAAGGGENAGPTLADFLKGSKKMSDDSSDDDDSSYMSDISGLTGVFPDYPEGRRGIKKAVVVRSKDSILLPKDHVKSKNPVVLYELRFDKVVVRNYARILNDNPACTRGPSIGLGWEFEQEDFEIEDYEMKRGRFRRSNELILNRGKREKIVRDLGYTEKDIASAVRIANRIKGQRRQTINNLASSHIEETVEKYTRRVKNVIFMRKN
jgi:hypothetical protein